jgi:hypothetical protein
VATSSTTGLRHGLSLWQAVGISVSPGLARRLSLSLEKVDEAA